MLYTICVWESTSGKHFGFSDGTAISTSALTTSSSRNASSEHSVVVISWQESYRKIYIENIVETNLLCNLLQEYQS